MKKSLVIATISLLTMGSASILASEVTGLNIFVADTPARAADVNANFDAVKDAVDDNDARIDAAEAAITTKANSADVYIKPQVDTALGVKANLVDVYTKTQIDISLVTKANVSSVYTKSEVDNALDGKADSAEIYTQTQVDNLLSDKADAADVAVNTTDIAANTAAINGNTLDIADLLGGIKDGTCIGNDLNDKMVRVGPLCVDKYEASLWTTATGGTAINADTCSETGNDCSAGATKIYARSVPNTTPDANITWFQAQQACANSGKRLLTNAEWQMAAAGTPDPGASTDPVNFCNNGPVTPNTVVATGASTNGTNACVSNWDAYDMVGNLQEWVADWAPGGNASDSTANSNTYNNDSAIDVYEADDQGTGDNNFSAAITRGGAYGSGTGAGVFAFKADVSPASKFPSIGFRCAR